MNGDSVRRRPVAAFLAISFAVAIAIATVIYLLGLDVTKSGPAQLALLLVYMFSPLIASVLVMKLILREPVREKLMVRFRPNRWFALALVGPIVLAFAALGVGTLMPGSGFSLEMGYLAERYRAVVPPEELERMLAFPPAAIMAILVINALVAGATVSALAGFGEELGWRGFLQRELAPLGFWRSSMLIGAIWGLWHAPVILQGYNYPEAPVLGVIMMTVFGAVAGPVFSYVTVRARSVVAAAVMHGALNASSGISVVFLAGGTSLAVGPVGAAGIIVYGMAFAALAVYDLRYAPVRARFGEWRARLLDLVAVHVRVQRVQVFRELLVRRTVTRGVHV